MPLYEYECTACHRRTEKIQKFSDPELTVCPFCNGPLERTLTAPAVHFAGGGWYKDGYGSAKPAPAGSGESKGASSDAPASGGGPASSGEGGSAAGSASAAAPSAPTSSAPAAAAASSSGSKSDS